MLCRIAQDRTQGRYGRRVLALPHAVRHLVTKEGRFVFETCKQGNACGQQLCSSSMLQPCQDDSSTINYLPI